MAAELVLRTEKLAKRYGRIQAVDGVSLEVQRGDIFGFLGPNGAGKTTTIRMIVGLIRPTAGRVELLGRPMPAARRTALARVGAIVETPAFYGFLSGRANLELFAAMSGGAPRARVDRVLEVVGLQGRDRDLAGTYSYGMRQRLGIAQALLPDPVLILLDEPSLGLDPRGMKEMRDLILDLNRVHGITVCLSSHLLAEVQQVCNRIAILDHGKLLYQGEVGRLLSRTESFRVRAEPAEQARHAVAGFPDVAGVRGENGVLVVDLPADRVPELNARLVAGGVRVFEISPVQASLEEVFLQLTGPAAADASAHPSSLKTCAS
ncbi:MAG: ABC transporter ATP-binding protein [Planctomycetes bacterium]|nr:ABC transporter ATP-binding protein [Planctomycetota bacterium]